MTYTLAWKEYREQRTVWLAVAVMALLVLLAMTALLQPSEMAELAGLGLPAGLVVLLALAAVYGLACGASMFAGEIEARTLPFLDSLPAPRAALWRGKVVIGFVLSLTQGLVLAGIGAAVGLGLDHQEETFWALPLTAAEAFAWGLVGSALMRSALPASTLGAVPLAFSWLAGGVVLWPPPMPGIFVRLGLVVLALVVSRSLFCAPDRSRGPLRPRPDSPRRVVRTAQAAGADGAPSPITALVWLIRRQGWAEAVVLVVLAYIEGLFLPVGGLAQWLLVTLVAGVLCGTGAFRDEQSGDAARFLGERRLPPGLFWIVKLGMWLALGAVLVILMLISGLMAAGTGGPAALNAFGHDLLLGTAAGGLFLVLGLAYGFAVGQLVALVVRKAAVAVVLAILLAAPAAAVWIPSAVQGGLPGWQALAPAALLLAAGFLVRRQWASEQLTSRRAVLTLVGAVGLAVVATAAALAWRVAAVPDGGEPFDVAAFQRSLPSPEQNVAGSLIRRAAQGLKQREAELLPADQGRAEMPGPGVPLPGADGAAAPGAPAEELRNFPAEAELVALRGWSAATPELARWLDRLFEGDWAQALREAADQPLGVIENPSFLNVNSTIETTRQGQPMATLFTARAAQLQAAGKDAEALQHLSCVLALSRNLRNKTVSMSYLTGLPAERIALIGMERWLEGAVREPELLRQALAVLTKHEDELPPATDVVKADHLVLRNTLTHAEVVAQLAGDPGRSRVRTVAAGRWVAGTLQTPWERLRAERLLNAVTAGELRAAALSYPQAEELRSGWKAASVGASLVRGWAPADPGPEGDAVRKRLGELLAATWLHRLLPGGSEQLSLSRAAGLARLRGCRLQLALALYRAEEGKPAQFLESLVPKYLPAVPTDPFDEQPFRYRLSRGEQLLWHVLDTEPGRRERAVQAGQGIVWSIGPDGADDGGVRQGSSLSPQPRNWAGQRADLIFLVPVRPRAE